MPANRRYPGENPLVASKRIANNRRRSGLGMGPSRNMTRPISRPGVSGPARNRIPAFRSGPPMPRNAPAPVNAPRRNTPSPGYGGSRNMRRPSVGNVLTGRFNRGNRRY